MSSMYMFVVFSIFLIMGSAHAGEAPLVQPVASQLCPEPSARVCPPMGRGCYLNFGALRGASLRVIAARIYYVFLSDQNPSLDMKQRLSAIDPENNFLKLSRHEQRAVYYNALNSLQLDDDIVCDYKNNTQLTPDGRGGP